MKIGVQVSSFNWPGSPANIGKTFAHIGQTADEAGFSSLWVMDHFFQIQHIGPPEDPMLEGYSLLSFLAGVTKNIKLGTLVTGVIYRHPGILLKTVTTLDVLSGGRAWLGIGAGWFEAEAKGLGVPYPSTTKRFEQLEETLQLAHQMWKDDESPFNECAVPARAPHESPAAAKQTAPTDYDWRHGRTKNVAHGGPVRRCL